MISPTTTGVGPFNDGNPGALAGTGQRQEQRMSKHHTGYTNSVNSKSNICLVVNVLFLKSGNWCVAQCLEYDIAAQGKTFEQTFKAFQETFITQILACTEIGEDPYSEETISKAPHEYFTLWEGRCRQFESMPPVKIETSAIAAEIWFCPRVLLDEDVDQNNFRSEWNRRKK